MKLRIISTFLVVTAVSAWAVACSQEIRPVCLTGHGGYAVKYTLKPGQNVTGACAEKKGEVVGVQKFNPPDNPSDQTVALKTSTLTSLADPLGPGQTDADIISLGKLTSSDPDQNNRCIAPNMTEVRDVDGGTDIAYKFSNVQFYVTAQIPGTQFTSELAYTEGGCTANYDVVGVFPAVHCDDGNGNPDDTLCAQSGDHGALNPDFPVKCDPDLLLCVLDSNTVPALRSRR